MKRLGKQRNCINANSCSRGSVTAGVRRSAEGLAPRPPNVRRRQNRKRRRNSPAMSQEHKLPSSPPPQPHAAARCSLAEHREDDGCGSGRDAPQVHDVFSARAPLHQDRTHRQAGRQAGLTPVQPLCHLFKFLLFYFFTLSTCYAKDRRHRARPQLPQGGNGGQPNVEGLERRRGIIHCDVASAGSRAAAALFSLGGGLQAARPLSHKRRESRYCFIWMECREKAAPFQKPPPPPPPPLISLRPRDRDPSTGQC